MPHFGILFIGDLSRYLTTAARRDALLAKGFPVARRCIESGYFEPDRVREILVPLEEALQAKRAVGARVS